MSCCLPLLLRFVIHKNRRPKSSTPNLFHDLVLVHSRLHESKKIKATLNLLFTSTKLSKFVYSQSVHGTRSPSPTTTRCSTDLHSPIRNLHRHSSLSKSPHFFFQINNENEQRYYEFPYRSSNPLPLPLFPDDASHTPILNRNIHSKKETHLNLPLLQLTLVRRRHAGLAQSTISDLHTLFFKIHAGG